MVLLIDNYDSFTYMLADYVQQCGEKCLIIKNDALNESQLNDLQFDSILLSPGPKRPVNAGITNLVIEKYKDSKPILGICLGHQAIGEFFGAKLEKAIRPMHGKTSEILFENHFLFAGIKAPFLAMRYHSLVLENIKSPLQIIAKTKENEVMVIAHESKPIIGIQFHPESILTSQGLILLQNWFHYLNEI